MGSLDDDWTYPMFRIVMPSFRYTGSLVGVHVPPQVVEDNLKTGPSHVRGRRASRHLTSPLSLMEVSILSFVSESIGREMRRDENVRKYLKWTHCHQDRGTLLDPKETRGCSRKKKKKSWIVRRKK